MPGLAEPAVHERRHEPVRAHLPRPAQCPYTPGRAADTQKCIRAGGKHNDLDDVGLDTYHHTFFEMLGNWSFGDYFKKEAIEWAWELVVESLEISARNGFTRPFTSPVPASRASSTRKRTNFWAFCEKFRAVGLDPAIHIVNGNKKDNFWMMGDTGPCGPCSELHVDLTPAGDTQRLAGQQRRRALHRDLEPRLHPVQREPDGGTFSPLPAKHVDTGMGFERVTSIIQGTKNFTDFANAKISNYETDIFRPIFDELEKLSGKKYTSTLPGLGNGRPARAPAARRRQRRFGEPPNPTGQRPVPPRRQPLLNKSRSTSPSASSPTTSAR